MHQHLDIGQGEVDFGAFFAALERNGFDGILTACVFAWEDRAEESTRFMRETIDGYLSGGPRRRPWSPRPEPRRGRGAQHVSMY